MKEDDNLPEFINLGDFWRQKDSLQLSPPLIEGVLRKGHKMMISGPSKAGKSFALIELAIAIASGDEWLGFQCSKGKVLYVNFEIDRASFLNRIWDIYTALERKPPAHFRANFDILNLRGQSEPLNTFAPKLINKARFGGYSAIIIDPIYKILTGSENSNFAMARFVDNFDKIANECNCSVIYCHHHSKGNQSWKRPMDRASGAGVFSRDADAILDLIELELPPERRKAGVTAWRLTGTIREFSPFPPVDIWFNHPIHTVEHFDSKDLILPHHQLPSWKRAMNGRKTKEQKLQERQHRLEAAFDVCSCSGVVTISILSEYLGVSTQTIRNMIDQHPSFSRNEGVISRI